LNGGIFWSKGDGMNRVEWMTRRMSVLSCAAMSVLPPTIEQLREVAGRLGLRLTQEELEEYLELMKEGVAAYAMIEALPDYVPEVRYAREKGYRPQGEENRHGAWYWKSSVKGARGGKLAGRKIALKDNICVAGMPMSGGSSILEGYVPEIDATVATRILDAGGEIVGKSVCEYFSFSGGSHTSATGPVQNPRKSGYSAGGSSSGSAALVAAGEVEMAIGGDQGGSIRIPSSYCGVCGMKPTYGLVPYTGILSIEFTVDHTGPITANVADNASLLEVIAGPDGIDPRQNAAQGGREYTRGLKEDLGGLRIAVLREGFAHANSDAQVNAKVRAAAERLAKGGARVEEVSIAMHGFASALLVPILAEGALDAMKGNGFGTNHKGLYVTSLMSAMSKWRERANELSETMKTVLMLGEYMGRASEGRIYGKTQNIGRQLRAAYDAVFEKFDLLLMPTTPMAATRLPARDAGRKEIYERALEMLGNTAPFDLTAHPAMSVPCGKIGELPVGAMLVGKHFGEAGIYRGAAGLERSGDWERL
jgi:amidase